jgi:hypothetical protein
MNEQIASLVGARPIALSNRELKELPRCDDGLLWFATASINISSSL